MCFKKNQSSLPDQYFYLIIIISGAVLFFPFLGSVHLFDWDEINFAESAREMLLTGNYSRVQINFQPFWEKPPLFFWMQALSMRLFGVTEWAARFPNALCGVITLCWIYHIAREYFSSSLAKWWVVLYIGSLLPHFYFRTGIIDPWFNLFIFSGIWFLLRMHVLPVKARKNAILAGISIGFALLTKGPVGLLIPLFVVLIFFAIKKEMLWRHGLDMLLFFTIVFLVSSIWYGWELYENGTWFMREFLRYQLRLLTTEDAGHGGPVYYHFLVLLLGGFPASLLAIPAMISPPQQHAARTFHLGMLLLLLVTLIIFSIVKTKIIHYSSLCYLPLTFFAAYSVENASVKARSMLRWPVLGMAFAWGILFITIPLVGANLSSLLPYVSDLFVFASLSTTVHWPLWLCLPGLIYLLVLFLIATIWEKHFAAGVFFLCMANALLIFFTLWLFVPRIERYLQGPLIDFYKSMQDKNVWVETWGFKSYAHYFYTRRYPGQYPDEKNAILTGKTDKPVYVAVKVTKSSEFERHYPLFKKKILAGGYVIYEKSSE